MQNHYTYKPFLPTLKEAVGFLQLAETVVQKNHIHALSNAAVLHSSMAVEALANNLLQFLNLGKHLSDSVEKLSPISKIELFNQIMRRTSTIDHGMNCIQVFSDLISLRNWYVHPKIIGVPITGDTNSIGPHPYKECPHLALKYSPQTIEKQDAQKVVVALVNAVDELLLDNLGLEMKSMSCMFSARLVWNNQSGPVIPELEWANWLEQNLNCRPRFLLDHIAVRFNDAINRTTDSSETTQQVGASNAFGTAILRVSEIPE